MLIVGFSRLKARRRCHRLYHYRYVQHLTPKKPKLPLLRGTILHRLLDARAKKEKTEPILKEYEKQYGQLFREEREEYGDVIGDCRKIFETYCDTYASDGLTVVASEHEIRVELIPGRVTFKGTIDRVYLDKRAKLRWISDSKSHKNIPGEENRFHDLQTVFYLWLWNQENPRRPADGVMWDYLRTKLPTEPEILESGKLSQRANIDTTYAVARRVTEEYCKARKIPIGAFEPWLNTFRGREEKFLKRVFLPSPPQVMIDRLLVEMRMTAEEILERGDDDTRSLTKDCGFCEFRNLCHAELRGQDASYVRQHDFTLNEELLDEEAEESD